MLMKKMFLLSVLLFSALSSTAQEQRPYGTVTPAKNSYCAKRFPAAKASVVAPATARHNKAPKRDVDIISEQPAGKLMLMKRSGIDVIPLYGTPTPAAYNNKGTYVVMGDDGNVYFKSYVTDMANGGTWVKGTKNGDLVTISLPQVSCHLWYYGKEFTYYLYAMKKTTVTATDEWTGEEYTYQSWAPDSSVTSISYRMGADSSLTLDSATPDSLLLGGVLDEDGTWPGYGDMNCTFEPFYETPNSLPKGVETTDFVLGNYSAYGEKTQRLVSGAIANDTLYIKGFANILPQGVMKAKIEGNKAVMPTGQFLGVDSVYSTLCYAKASSYELDNDGGWITVYNYDAPEVTFDYDADKGLFAADTNAILVNAGNDEILFHECYLKPFFRRYVEQPVVPAQPVWTSFMAYNDTYQYGYACFDLKHEDEEGNYINPANLYYRIYLDDDSEPCDFTLASESGDSVTVTDIPYNYSDDNILGGGNDYHVIYYNMSGFEKMGIQSVYKSQGVEKTSDIVYSTTLGLKSVEDKSGSQSVTYYNLSGIRVTAPVSGIYVKRTQRADGTVSIQKVLRR